MTTTAKKRLSFSNLSAKRGSALITVSIFSAIVLLIALGSVTSITYQTRLGGRSIAYKQSLALAEAGAEIALAQLNKTVNTWPGWTTSGPNRVRANQTLTDTDGNGVGTYTVTVKDAASNTPLISSVGVAHRGSSGPVTREIRIPVKNNTIPSPFGSYGIFSKTDMNFVNNNQFNGTAAANGNITIKNPSKNSTGGLQAGGTITGQKIPEEIVEGVMPTAPPNFPDAELETAKTSNDNNKIYKLVNGVALPLGVSTNGIFDFAAHGTIRFPAGTYYLDHLTIASNTFIETDGVVKLFLDPGAGKKAIDFSNGKNGADLNNESNASNLQFFVKSGNIELGSNFHSHCGLFAPNSEILMKSNTWITGAVIANNLILEANAGINTVQGLLLPADGDGFVAGGWTEIAATK